MDNLRPAELDSPLNRPVRAFLGIGPAPKAWADSLNAWVAQTIRLFGAFGSSIKWTPPENLHVTLRFFGAISQEQVLTVSELLGRIAADRKRFQLRSTDLALFPHRGRPRIIGISMEDESGGLLLLERHIRAGAGQIGQLPEDREFHPHVTFGRMRDENSREQRIIGARWLERGIPELPLWNVEKVTLFQSQTQRSGPIYSPLATFPLAGG